MMPARSRLFSKEGSSYKRAAAARGMLLLVAAAFIDFLFYKFYNVFNHFIDFNHRVYAIFLQHLQFGEVDNL